MQVQIQKWGDSLILKIPDELIEKAGLTVDSMVELTLLDDHLALNVSEKAAYTLEELLEGMTREHVHGEIDTGKPIGNEAW